MSLSYPQNYWFLTLSTDLQLKSLYLQIFLERRDGVLQLWLNTSLTGWQVSIRWRTLMPLFSEVYYSSWFELQTSWKPPLALPNDFHPYFGNHLTMFCRFNKWFNIYTPLLNVSMIVSHYLANQSCMHNLHVICVLLQRSVGLRIFPPYLTKFDSMATLPNSKKT